jgi:type IV secretion system protein VirB9
MSARWHMKCLAFAALVQQVGQAAPLPTADARIRVLPYATDEVYRLKGFVGYQVDLEFELGESFLGLGSGDLESLTFAAQANHLFIKPRVGGIDTNLTVLTSRRVYQFDYSTSAHRPDPAFGDVVYVLRFTYPAVVPATQLLEQRLNDGSGTRAHNLHYGYCGNPQLKPLSAWDDGVQTHLRFAPQQELPALFLRNEDGSESLVNFTVVADELIVHRISRRFVVRRGRLEDCVVNEAYSGGGESLPSGTVAPAVERITRGPAP